MTNARANLRHAIRLIARAIRHVRIVPRGANNPLPPVPDEVEITEGDIRRALDDWDETFPKYAGMLDAEVEDDG